MKNKIILLFLGIAVISGEAMATSRTVTLDIKNMTCAVCPITVKKALEHVSGVQQVLVNYASKTATVEFDDAKATTDKLSEATTEAGYPSTLKEMGK